MRNTKSERKREQIQEGDFLFKVIVLGDRNVGRTLLIKRFLGLGIDEPLGIDNALPNYVTTLDNTKIFFSIWDSSFSKNKGIIRMSRGITLGASGALLIFDCSRRRTATNILKLGELVTTRADRPISLMVVGNKIDLRHHKPKAMTYGEGKKIATTLAERTKSTDNVSYMETSAKDDINVRKTFQALSASIVTLLTKKNLLHEDFYKSRVRKKKIITK